MSNILKTKNIQSHYVFKVLINDMFIYNKKKKTLLIISAHYSPYSPKDSKRVLNSPFQEVGTIVFGKVLALSVTTPSQFQ